MTEPLNAKGRPFSWSFTALTNFEGCPKRYADEKFYCQVPFVETEAVIWGNRVHKTAEQFLKGERVSKPDLLPPIQPYLNTIVAASKKDVCKLEVELEICFDRNFNIVRDWFSKEAWFRCKLDVAVLNFPESKANVFDWKTGGKIKDDPDQLKIFAAALSKVYVGILEFVPKYIWTKHKEVTGIGGNGTIHKDEIAGIWEGVLGRVRRMEDAWASEYFPARPSGLCPWCGSYDTCKDARRRR